MQRELNTATGSVLQMVKAKVRKKKKYVEKSGRFKEVKGSRFKGCVESMMAKGKSKEDAQKICAFIGRKAGRIRSGEEFYTDARFKSLTKIKHLKKLKKLKKKKRTQDALVESAAKTFDPKSIHAATLEEQAAWGRIAAREKAAMKGVAAAGGVMTAGLLGAAYIHGKSEKKANVKTLKTMRQKYGAPKAKFKGQLGWWVTMRGGGRVFISDVGKGLSGTTPAAGEYGIGLHRPKGQKAVNLVAYLDKKGLVPLTHSPRSGEEFYTDARLAKRLAKMHKFSSHLWGPAGKKMMDEAAALAKVQKALNKKYKKIDYKAPAPGTTYAEWAGPRKKIARKKVVIDSTGSMQVDAYKPPRDLEGLKRRLAKSMEAFNKKSQKLEGLKGAAIIGLGVGAAAGITKLVVSARRKKRSASMRKKYGEPTVAYKGGKGWWVSAKGRRIFIKDYANQSAAAGKRSDEANLSTDMLEYTMAAFPEVRAEAKKLKSEATGSYTKGSSDTATTDITLKKMHAKRLARSKKLAAKYGEPSKAYKGGKGWWVTSKSGWSMWLKDYRSTSEFYPNERIYKSLIKGAKSWGSKAGSWGRRVKSFASKWSGKAKKAAPGWGSKAKSWGSKAKSWGATGATKTKGYAAFGAKKAKAGFGKVSKAAPGWGKKAKQFGQTTIDKGVAGGWGLSGRAKAKAGEIAVKAGQRLAKKRAALSKLASKYGQSAATGPAGEKGWWLLAKGKKIFVEDALPKAKKAGQAMAAGAGVAATKGKAYARLGRRKASAGLAKGKAYARLGRKKLRRGYRKGRMALRRAKKAGVGSYQASVTDAGLRKKYSSYGRSGEEFYPRERNTGLTMLHAEEFYTNARFAKRLAKSIVQFAKGGKKKYIKAVQKAKKAKKSGKADDDFTFAHPLTVGKHTGDPRYARRIKRLRIQKLKKSAKISAGTAGGVAIAVGGPAATVSMRNKARTKKLADLEAKYGKPTAEFKGKKGWWITSNGRRLFISAGESGGFMKHWGVGKATAASPERRSAEEFYTEQRGLAGAIRVLKKGMHVLKGVSPKVRRQRKTDYAAALERTRLKRQRYGNAATRTVAQVKQSRARRLKKQLKSDTKSSHLKKIMPIHAQNTNKARRIGSIARAKALAKAKSPTHRAKEWLKGAGEKGMSAARRLPSTVGTGGILAGGAVAGAVAGAGIVAAMKKKYGPAKAEFKGESGWWVSSGGRRIFIKDK